MTKHEIRFTSRGSCTGRFRAVIAIAVSLACCISCARSLRNPFASAGPPAPDLLVAAAPLDQIIAAVNANAQKIRTYQTNNASIEIPGALGIPTLRGNIAVERPGRVRLQASTALTGPEVDLGSNEELFWFWVKRNEPPQVYFARHSQIVGSAAQQLMPIDPQWLQDALGLAEFKPTDRHEGPLPLGKDRVEIKSYIQSASGPLVKRTVIDSTKAWVIEQHLYDAAGKPLASAVAKNHRYYPETQVSLPQEIDIRIPPAELAMTIDVGTVELNRLASNAAMFAIPQIQGSPARDLGAAPPAQPGGEVRSMGGQISDADWYAPTPSSGAPAAMGAAPPSQIAIGTAQPVGAPLPAALPMGLAPAPQFVPPGGVAQVAPSMPPMQSPSTATPTASSAQRLPAGGVPATGGFVR
jgi:hypothetical protein